MPKQISAAVQSLYQSFIKLSDGEQVDFWNRCCSSQKENVIRGRAGTIQRLFDLLDEWEESKKESNDQAERLKWLLSRAFECWGDDQKKLEPLDRKGKRRGPLEERIVQLRGQGMDYLDIGLHDEVRALNGGKILGRDRGEPWANTAVQRRRLRATVKKAYERAIAKCTVV